MNKNFLSFALTAGLTLSALSISQSAFAGGGTLNPDPSRGGRGECHTTWASDGSTREVCTGGARPSPGGSAPPVGRSTPTPVSYACPTAVSASAEFAGEGKLELLATAHHASTYVGSVTSCHYTVDMLTLNNVAATAVDHLELEFYSAGRIFLSMVNAYGEKSGSAF